MPYEDLCLAIGRDENHPGVDEDGEPNTPIKPKDDPECFCIRCCAIRFLAKP